MVRLDRFDIQLLNIVQRDASLTADELAGSVSLSVSAIQRRLRRLRESGVITGHVAVVDPRSTGGLTHFVVSLQVERESLELMGQLRSWLAGEDRVQQAYYVTGEADLVLIVAAADTESYDALMSRLLLENPNVKRYTTNVALNVIKRGMFVQIPGDIAE